MTGAAGVALVSVAVMVFGAGAAMVRRPGPVLTSIVQHLAAGVVFAAAAGEILPGLKHAGAAVPILVGGVTGTAAMLAIKQLGQRAAGPVGLAATAGVDLLVDGLVLGIGFAAGARQGMLLAVALTLEVLFLGLALAVALREWLPAARAVAATGAIGLLLPVGALLGGPVAALPQFWLDTAFAFGLVALLYLVTEELLVEAHEQPDTPAATAAFFTGFLALLLLEEVL